MMVLVEIIARSLNLNGVIKVVLKPLDDGTLHCESGEDTFIWQTQLV